MELLQLKYFFESAKNESFAKTAEKYSVPPSCVSATVRRLEKELGCALFDRHYNKITLNANGERLERSVGIILDELDRAVADIESHRTKGEQVEIKVLAKSLRSNLVNTIIDYKETHPDVNFKTVLDFADNDYSSYDVIVAPQNEIIEGFERDELFNARLRMIVCADYPLPKRELTLSELRNEPFIIMGRQAPSYKTLLSACKNAGFTPKIVMEVNDRAEQSTCIHRGAGIAIVRERDLSNSPHLRFLSVSDFVERDIYYVYYKSTKKSPYVNEFIKTLKKRIMQK